MTAWLRAGSSYVRECRPGYEAVVELSGACAYAVPWGTAEQAEGAVLTVMERATGLAVAKRLRLAGATSPGDVDDLAESIADTRIGKEAAKAEELATRGWHLDEAAGILSVAARGSRAATECPLSLARLGDAPEGEPCFAIAPAGGGGYAASWLPDGTLGPSAVESEPCPTPSEALARLAGQLVEQGMLSGGGEDDDLARYERLYAGDMETYERTNLDDLIRACRASARHGTVEKGGGGR